MQGFYYGRPNEYGKTAPLAGKPRLRSSTTLPARIQSSRGPTLYQPITMFDSMTLRAWSEVGARFVHVEPDGVHLVAGGLGQAIAGDGADIDPLVRQAQGPFADHPGVAGPLRHADDFVASGKPRGRRRRRPSRRRPR